MNRHRCLLAVPAAALALTASAACGGGGSKGAGEVAPATASATASASGGWASASAGASAPAAEVSAQDRAWLTAVHQTNLAEVQVGELARKKGGTAAVRSAGEMLTADHGRLDTQVTRVAGALGVSLPKTPAPEQKEAADRLANKSGSRFDHDFLTTMIAGHQAMIAKTKAEIAQGSNPQVRALARETLPHLIEHLGMLRKVQSSG